MDEPKLDRVAPRNDPARTAALTASALVAFAANSLLCRLALGRETIDAAGFVGLRLVSGALLLALVALVRQRTPRLRPDWAAVAALFVYMALFSFAYVSLGAGAGALILFGAVQLTMFAAGLGRGERFSPAAWAGVLAAALGLVYLVSPGLTAPDPGGAALMAIAGVAWGLYSLLGKRAADPLMANASNFIYALPLGAALCLAFRTTVEVSAPGALLAIASGAIASGLGYVVWYAALAHLSATRAAIVQLAVPVIAALAGVPLLGEPITLRLGIASLVTLGGIAVVLTRPAPPHRV